VVPGFKVPKIDIELSDKLSPEELGIGIGLSLDVPVIKKAAPQIKSVPPTLPSFYQAVGIARNAGRRK
jgi:hypothetical protein